MNKTGSSALGVVVALAFFWTVFALVSCGQVRNGRDGVNGPTGVQGPTGSPGDNGTNGHSMVFTKTDVTPCAYGGYTLLIAIDTNDSGVLEPSDDANVQSITLCNGHDGSDAPPTPFTPVAILDPCGKAPNRYNEVLLKLADGSVLVSFSDNASGQNTRFSLLTDGTYQTTDGDNCVFTLTNGEITYENHKY